MVITNYSVIIPVFNEAEILPETVPSLLKAVGKDCAEIVYVCNGCDDGSAKIIEALSQGSAKIVEIATKSKLEAFNAGEAQVTAFPRFFVDADCSFPPCAFRQLLQAFSDPTVELVSPSLYFDSRKASRAAQRITQVWSSLPHARRHGFNAVLGVSERGRSRWNGWSGYETVFADDALISTAIPEQARKIVRSVIVKTNSPATFFGWVRTRSRWRRANCNFEKTGRKIQTAPGQRADLLKLSFREPRAVTTYVICYFLALAISKFESRNDWSRYRTKE